MATTWRDTTRGAVLLVILVLSLSGARANAQEPAPLTVPLTVPGAAVEELSPELQAIVDDALTSDVRARIRARRAINDLPDQDRLPVCRAVAEKANADLAAMAVKVLLRLEPQRGLSVLRRRAAELGTAFCQWSLRFHRMEPGPDGKPQDTMSAEVRRRAALELLAAVDELPAEHTWDDVESAIGAAVHILQSHTSPSFDPQTQDLIRRVAHRTESLGLVRLMGHFTGDTADDRAWIESLLREAESPDANFELYIRSTLLRLRGDDPPREEVAALVALLDARRARSERMLADFNGRNVYYLLRRQSEQLIRDAGALLTLAALPDAERLRQHRALLDSRADHLRVLGVAMSTCRSPLDLRAWIDEQKALGRRPGLRAAEIEEFARIDGVFPPAEGDTRSLLDRKRDAEKAGSPLATYAGMTNLDCLDD